MPGSRELEFIEWLRERIAPDERVPVGIGDDTAVLSSGVDHLLVTTDMLLEGVHFDLAICRPYDVGRKAMNVNLSDIAAMAGQPTAAVVATGLPRNIAEDFPAELFRGLRNAAQTFAVALIGGDTNRSAGGLVVSVTVLGTPTGSGPVLRSGARPGDAILVTGQLGYSQSGHHLSFTPRVREAQLLHEFCELHSMIDLSDGLGSDLFHLTEESDCGAILDAEAIPIREVQILEEPSDSAAASSSTGSDGRSAVDHALDDGEDFELLFTVADSDAERIFSEQPLEEFGTLVTRIGQIVSEPGVLLRSSGELRRLDRRGFSHDW